MTSVKDSKQFALNKKDLINLGIAFLIIIATTITTSTEEIKSLLVQYGISPEIASMATIMIGLVLKRFLMGKEIDESSK